MNCRIHVSYPQLQNESLAATIKTALSQRELSGIMNSNVVSAIINDVSLPQILILIEQGSDFQNKSSTCQEIITVSSKYMVVSGQFMLTRGGRESRGAKFVITKVEQT